MTRGIIHRWNAEAEWRIQLTPIKPDVKEICKICKTMPLFSLDDFALENIAIFFFKNLLFLLT